MTENNSSYFTEIGGDFKGIQGPVSGGTITQYIITQKSGIEIRDQPLIRGSPYLGLRKFEAKDRSKFFGRDRWITDLTTYLNDNNVLLLLGASGSGKSSLIQAGLIPTLEDQADGGRFINFTFVPDINPFESFYGCLLTKYHQSQAKLAQTAQEDTLIRVVRALKNDSQWLIFIDQFEELFTLTPKQIRDIFIKSLVELIKNADSSVKIILTMRADFLDKLTPYADLVEIHNSYQYLLGDMDDSELRLAIAEPAARNGVIFETGLIDRIIADFHRQPGALPLLQYTLNLLWKNDDIEDRILNTKTYQDLGGVTGALQQQADKIYNELEEKERKATEQIFLELIGLEDKEPVSRRADKSSFGEDNIQAEVLNKLIDNRLLVSKGEEGKATVEVAHEALLRCWKVLQDLIREKQEIIVLKHRLYTDAKQWDEMRKKDQQKATGELWNGSKLARIIELRNEGDEGALPNLDRVAIAFIDSSVAEVERQEREREEQRQRELEAAQKLAQAQAQARQEAERRERQQKQANKKLRQRAILLVFVAVIAISAALFAWKQTQQAEYNLANALGLSSLSLFNEGKELDAFVQIIKAGKILQKQHTTSSDVTNALQEILNRKSEYNRLQGHDSSVSSVSFSPDGKTLASGSADETIKLWNIKTGKEIRTLQGHDSYIWSVSFSPDGKTLASGSNDKTIKLWNVETGKEIRTLKGHDSSVSSVRFSPDGKTLASGSNDKTIKLWNVEMGKEIRTLKGHDSSVNSVNFSPDGKTLASGSYDKTIKLWNVETGKEIRTLKGHDNFVNSVNFNADGKILASGSWDNTIKLWNVETGKETRTLKGHDNFVWSVSFSPDGTTLASGSGDNTIKLWNVETAKEIRTLKGHDYSVNSVSFSPDGKTLASGSDDNTIKLWNVETAKEIRTLKGHDFSVNSVRFSPDGKTLASGSWDNTIKLWNVETAKEIRTLKGHDFSVDSVSYSPDGKTLASGSRDNTIKLWNVETGKEIRTLKGHDYSVNSVRFSPDGKILASGSLDSTIKLWNVETGKEIHTLKGHDNFVWSVSFSPDGKTLASGSDDKTIKLWNVETGKEIRTLKGHDFSVRSVSFSPDGKILASGSDDKTIKLWNVETAKEIRTLKGHDNYVYSVSFSPDGKTLASGSADQTIKLWYRSTGWDLDALMGRSCDWVRNYLTYNSKVSESDRHLCDGIGAKKP